MVTDGVFTGIVRTAEVIHVSLVALNNVPLIVFALKYFVKLFPKYVVSTPAVMVKGEVVAPGILTKLTPSIDTCHCNVLAARAGEELAVRVSGWLTQMDDLSEDTFTELG